MMALTVKQPWAHLLVHGLKRFEFRRWAMPGRYAGEPIAIHAGVKFDHGAWPAMLQAACDQSLAQQGLLARALQAAPTADDYQARAFVGAVRFGHSIVGRSLARALDLPPDDPPDMFGWPVLSAVAYATPIDYPGKLGLWLPPDAIAQQLARPPAADKARIAS